MANSQLWPLQPIGLAIGTTNERVGSCPSRVLPKARHHLERRSPVSVNPLVRSTDLCRGAWRHVGQFALTTTGHVSLQKVWLPGIGSRRIRSKLGDERFRKGSRSYLS